MNKLQKTGIIAVTAFAMVFAAPLTLAQTTDTSVINSGDGARIDSSSSSRSSVDVSNSNSAHISQYVNAIINTGGNQASENIGGGVISTGAALGSVELDVTANNNTTGVAGLTNGGSGLNLTDVVNTGDHAHVDTHTSTSSRTSVNNNNQATVYQDVFGKVNTGHNSADENIDGGTIHTGPATFGVGLDVTANKNLSGVGSGIGGGSLVNDTFITNTGDDASIHSSASSHNSTRVSNYNSLWVSQSVHGGANSGDNRANENIGGGDIHTSGAAFLIDLAVHGNSNVTGIGGGSSLSPLSWNLGDIVNTGDDLDSDTSVDTSSHVRVHNDNSLHSYQSMGVWSSSGHNKVNENIDNSSIHSGPAGAVASFDVTGNHNATWTGWFGSFGSWLM